MVCCEETLIKHKVSSIHSGKLAEYSNTHTYIQTHNEWTLIYFQSGHMHSKQRLYIIFKGPNNQTAHYTLTYKS